MNIWNSAGAAGGKIAEVRAVGRGFGTNIASVEKAYDFSKFRELSLKPYLTERNDNMPVRQGTKSKIVYFSPQEWEIVCKRTEKCGKQTGTFIRDIAVQGTIKIFDTKPINSFLISFNRIGNEINQIAKAANSTQSIYKKDIEDLKTSFGFLDNMIRNYLKPLKNEINL